MTLDKNEILKKIGEIDMFLMFKKKCAVCKQKAIEPRKYYDDQHKAVLVCVKC